MRHHHALLLALPVLAACGGPVRVDLDPPSVKLFGKGQTALVHATPRDKGGKPSPENACAWSSSDPKVVTVSAKQNDATITSVGAGTATVTCAIGDVKSELTAAVRTVARVTASPALVKLELADDRTPVALQVQAVDDEGAPVSGRIAFTRCQDEEICRGDARGQLWAVGPGKTTAVVEVQGASTTVAVEVKDVRTYTKPEVLKKGYMEDLEKKVQKQQAAEAAAAAKAARGP